MATITLRTQVESIEVTGGGYNSVDVEIGGLDTDDVLKEMEVKEILYYYTDGDLLDEIGKEAAIEHFGIEEKE